MDEPSVLIAKTDSREQYGLCLLFAGLLYRVCADMTLCPGINLHTGKMWPGLNYVKRLIQVIHYKGFTPSPKTHAKGASFFRSWSFSSATFNERLRKELGISCTPRAHRITLNRDESIWGWTRVDTFENGIPYAWHFSEGWLDPHTNAVYVSRALCAGVPYVTCAGGMQKASSVCISPDRPDSMSKGCTVRLLSHFLLTKYIGTR